MPGGAATGAFGSGVVKSATGRRPGRRGDVDAGVGCGIGAPNDHIEVVDVRRTGVLSPVDGRQAAAAAGIARLGRRNDGLETEIADILAAESDLRAEAGVAASSIIVTVAGLLLGPADSESPPLGVLPSTLNANAPLSARSGIFGGLESRVASAKALPISCSISSSTASILPFFSFICGASRSDKLVPAFGRAWLCIKRAGQDVPIPPNLQSSKVLVESLGLPAVFVTLPTSPSVFVTLTFCVRRIQRDSGL